MRRRRRWERLRGAAMLLLPFIAAGVLVFFASALDSLDSGRQAQSMAQLEQAVRRGCTACYAAEGVYPPSLDYLQSHYGLQIDESRYTVRYAVIGENLMPDITVLENDA